MLCISYLSVHYFAFVNYSFGYFVLNVLIESFIALLISFLVLLNFEEKKYLIQSCIKLMRK